MTTIVSERDSSTGDESDPDERTAESIEEQDDIGHLKKELSQIPFCELQDLRNKVGSKRYNQAIHGVLEERKKVKSSDKDKKKSKNNPLEQSSKKKVPKLRQVVVTKKKATRDPRFDDLSGKFNEEMFSKVYNFVDEIRAKEKKGIEKDFKKVKNAEKKEKLQNLLKTMDQHDKSKESKKKREEEQQQRKKVELEQIKQGKRPYYLKKSEQKRLELAEKYKQLKSTGKLQTYLSKRRKKTASKDRRHLPYRRDPDS